MKDYAKPWSLPTLVNVQFSRAEIVALIRSIAARVDADATLRANRRAARIFNQWLAFHGYKKVANEIMGKRRKK